MGSRQSAVLVAVVDELVELSELLEVPFDDVVESVLLDDEVVSLVDAALALLVLARLEEPPRLSFL